jgi:serine phosphatase RsbU (regulator of sigma subunit)
MSEKKSTRVAIASEQAIFLRGLQALTLTRPSLRLVGEAHTPGDALQLCQMAEPEMLLLDLNPNPGKWHEAIRALHLHWPALKVVLLIEPQDQTWAVEEFPAIPLYCVSRDVSEDEFHAAMNEIELDSERHLAAQRQGAYSHTAEEVDEEPFELQTLGKISSKVRNEVILERELVMAGKIQADILPEDSPTLPGWDIAARLTPANETSGDFYDFIPLSDHKMGILVADVTDKGMGAALFMALTSTLIRTYAARYPTLPAIALSTVSDRILSDTRGGMFVTTFYCVLEPHTGRLLYANAGHPAGLHISMRRGKESITRLRPTGMALGVSEEARWKQKEARIAPGDLLVLYTDGITEASNLGGTFYDEDRLIETILNHPNTSAQQLLEALLEDVQRFVGHVPRQDDIALIVMHREE